MLGFKRFNLLVALIFISLLLLLLLISCNPNSELRGNLNEMGVNVGEDYNELQLKMLINTFALMNEEQAALDKIRSIVTSPEIGASKGYKTYSVFEFYDFLKTLGVLDAKKVIRNYLKVDKRQRELQDAFEESLYSIYDLDKREQLQIQLDEQKNSCSLRLKQLFSDEDVYSVYVKIADDNYVKQAVEHTAVGLAKLRSQVRGVVEDGDVYLRLSFHEQNVIDEIKGIVTNPYIASYDGYKTYTESQFYDLLNTMGISNVTELIILYERYLRIRAIDYSDIKAELESIEDLDIRSELQQHLAYVSRIYQVSLKGAFSDFNLDLVFKVLKENRDSVFVDIYNCIEYVKVFEEIYKKLSIIEKNAVRYMQNINLNYRQNIGSRPCNISFKIVLGGLGLSKVKEILDVHLKTLQARDTARSILMQVPVSEVKQIIEKHFDKLVLGYDSYLKQCFYNAVSYQDVYNRMFDDKYMKSFIQVQAEASLKLYPKR